MHRILVAALLAAAPALAGCLADEAAPDCPTPRVEVFHHGLDAGPTIAAGEQLPLVVWVKNPANATIEATIHTSPPPVAHLEDSRAPAAGPVNLTVAPNTTGMEALWLAPDGSSRQIEIEVTSRTIANPDEDGARARACEPDAGLTRTLGINQVEDAPRAQAGKGVLVRTVGWWTNGSSFYTNHAGYHEAGLPRAYLGPYNGSDPLKVYVYNETGDEMPERYNDSGYATTIPGFNEALKGIPTAGARMTYLEPDEAYTRDGYEDHPLYGDAMLFYIEAIEVRAEPCQVPQPVCTPPGEDDVPPFPPALESPVPLSR